MRVLQYRKDHNHHSGEILDEILLVIGLFGEIVYCCIGECIDLYIKMLPERSIFKKVFFFIVFLVFAL